MKLRNKKTGEIGDLMGSESSCSFIIIDIDFHDGNPRAFDYSSLTELNEDWEDYEPLIKDEKIRKLVRGWAKINGFIEVKLLVDSEYGFQFEGGSGFGRISFPSRTIELEHPKEYTITELCGEEE